MHLAQLNIAEALDSMDSTIMADFVNNTDRINALAEAHAGFVWRLKGEDTDDAYSIQAFDNERILTNMSIWKDKESLFDYVYRSGHIEIFKRKKEWFSHLKKMHMVLWYIEEGHIPTLEEAKERLVHLQTHGESKYAFSFKSSY
ncbi:MAG: DUF3291 domain-containing protein [Bacteroidetes bacterium]|nr:DUF3291 domain-containing protein [Bacteroidota bacterium]